MNLIASYCLTEAGSGSDAAGMKTKAKYHKDNRSYEINGSKSFISGAGESDLYFVMLKTEDKLKDSISCVIVEKDSDGITFGKNEDKMGWKNQPTRTISFDNCVTPISNIVGREGDGFKIAMQGLDGGRINIASCSLGIARFCIDKTITYVNERKQFGKFLKEFQSIQFKIADMITEYNAARLMVHKAATSLEKRKTQLLTLQWQKDMLLMSVLKFVMKLYKFMEVTGICRILELKKWLEIAEFIKSLKEQMK